MKPMSKAFFGCGQRFFIRLQILVQNVSSPLKSCCLRSAFLLDPSELNFFDCFLQRFKLFGCHSSEWSTSIWFQSNSRIYGEKLNTGLFRWRSIGTRNGVKVAEIAVRAFPPSVAFQARLIAQGSYGIPVILSCSLSLYRADVFFAMPTKPVAKKPIPGKPAQKNVFQKKPSPYKTKDVRILKETPQ